MTSQPFESTPPEWAIKQAFTALRGGMSAPEVEQQLVAVGLDQAAAKTVVLRAGSELSGPPPMLDWAMEHARAGLRAGLKVPDIERQLVARGLAPEIAEAVVTNVLGERVRRMEPDRPEQRRRLMLHRIASGGVAFLCLLIAYRFLSGYVLFRTAPALLFPLLFIWFADHVSKMSGRFRDAKSVPAFVVRWLAWSVLLLNLLFLIVLAL
jgi:hypothetical protein